MHYAESKENLAEFKQGLSITAVAEALGLAPEHGKFRCFNPSRHSHADRTPSVSLSEEKGLYRCWVCPDVRGDIINLVQQVRLCGFHEAIEWLRDSFPQNTPLLKSQAPFQKSPVPSLEPSIFSQSFRNSSHPEPYWREKTILAFLRLLSPIESSNSKESNPAMEYLIGRKIFRKTWTAMRLRWVDDYGRINDALRRDFDTNLLQEVGITNEQGNLRFYKHRLILPYLDEQNRPLHFQARALNSEVTPKELSLKGHIPCPYNRKALDQRPGFLYLCEGPIDTLTLIERGIPAVGIPGVGHLKPEWISLFAQKQVILCFDNDEAGRIATGKTIELFHQQGIEAKAFSVLPDGTDINDWFVRPQKKPRETRGENSSET
ncbi:MAG TPA: toprim domain-containing protein [Fibrobacteraceae bacterium]|nr:toprim domain-containing protein [Fibrobacteraceae bacterium]